MFDLLTSWLHRNNTNNCLYYTPHQQQCFLEKYGYMRWPNFKSMISRPGEVMDINKSYNSMAIFIMDIHFSCNAKREEIVSNKYI